MIFERKEDFFNFATKKEKEKVKRFIQQLGYLNSNDLKAHMYECNVCRKHKFMNACINDIIKHWSL